MIQTISYKPFKHGNPVGYHRADLEFYGIDHFKPSYTAYIFFNEKVTKRNFEKKREQAIGSFSIFGHAKCGGDDGHCHVDLEARRFDDRPSPPLTPAFRRVVVTDALKKAVEQRDDLEICIVAESDEDADSLLKLSGLQLVTFC